MFELLGVIKSFGPVKAVGPIDLTTRQGETTVLIGPSGCGKSTLLRVMIGLSIPVAGTVLFGGMPVDPATAPTLRRRMGYVIQEGGLFPHLSGRDNVALMARHLGQPDTAIAERLATLTALTRLPEDALDRFPAQLSGGQRQRVALMRALMLDPDVLLLDEPLGALDPMIRHDLQAELRDIFRALGKTVIMVTHDIGEAGYFADHIVLLRDGCIAQQGDIADLVANPANDFVARFMAAQRGLAEVIAERGR
ncbi:MAG: ATP-binding cassette domain-containing protein [Alphaproteobacteria bacterium]